MIRVMIVARHTEVREGLITVLGLAEGIQIADVVSSPENAIRIAKDTCPDVALVDLEMPEGEGYEAIRQLRKICQCTRIIALTAHDYPSARESATQSGASEVMVKGLDVPGMVAVIQAAVGDKKEHRDNSHQS